MARLSFNHILFVALLCVDHAFALSCYYYDGNTSSSDQQLCPGTSQCCGVDATCTETRLCDKPGEADGTLVRGPCAVYPWDPTLCASVCLYDELNGRFPRVKQCTNGKYCCDNDSACCDNDRGVLLDSAGNIIQSSSSSPSSQSSQSSSTSTASSVSTTLPGLVSTTSASSSTTSAPTSTSTSAPASSSSSLSQGARVGLGVGISVGAIAIFAAAFFAWRHRRNRRNAAPTGTHHELPSYYDKEDAPAGKVVYAHNATHELGHNDTHELADTSPHELEAPILKPTPT
ncbi:Nn.00g050700.m01.CDS01 [Neocucurbitaria sp. VM-36]